ncbi:uncharacterized protein PFL1_01504 [Pseudozyma flocculosa PF-1]|uniref:Secreted protein n=1 Tax=Pseudozyma flocculosa TaxID=84751 RepID=A0A5C3FDM0_9BASI|nr:uncharacterized protein PFL1_01504 [Pseudozyma flocculosa PF-1]EPQ31320.1 hypothetical protein PFL1_01504 [Pseudozyma flocculosa PF-1]SPO41785.1 uncharacterized protein PSFLO_07267 [Pseudozyma flocculosa]
MKWHRCLVVALATAWFTPLTLLLMPLPATRAVRVNIDGRFQPAYAEVLARIAEWEPNMAPYRFGIMPDGNFFVGTDPGTDFPPVFYRMLRRRGLFYRAVHRSEPRGKVTAPSSAAPAADVAGARKKGGGEVPPVEVLGPALQGQSSVATSQQAKAPGRTPPLAPDPSLPPDHLAPDSVGHPETPGPLEHPHSTVDTKVSSQPRRVSPLGDTAISTTDPVDPAELISPTHPLHPWRRIYVSEPSASAQYDRDGDDLLSYFEQHAGGQRR